MNPAGRSVRAAAVTTALCLALPGCSHRARESAGVPVEPPVKVRTESVSTLVVPASIRLTGTIPLSFEAATARAQLAAQNVGDGLLRAPFDGVVTERYVEVGQFLRQDSRVVSIASLDPLRLEMAVPEANLAKVQVGAEVSFRVAAYPERAFAGKLRYVSGAVRQSTRDPIVEAVVPNTDGALKPGMFADVQLVTGQRSLPGVPRSAIAARDGEPPGDDLVTHGGVRATGSRTWRTST